MSIGFFQFLCFLTIIPHESTENARRRPFRDFPALAVREKSPFSLIHTLLLFLTFPSARTLSAPGGHRVKKDSRHHLLPRSAGALFRCFAAAGGHGRRFGSCFAFFLCLSQLYVVDNRRRFYFTFVSTSFILNCIAMSPKGGDTCALVLHHCVKERQHKEDKKWQSEKT